MDKKIFIKAKVYIPSDYIDKKVLLKHYEFYRYEEKVCKTCEFLPERLSLKKPCGECWNCPAYLGKIKLWGEKEIRNTNYISLPNGNLPKIESLLKVDLSNAVDLRCKKKFVHKIKFTGKLFTGEKVDGLDTANQVKLTMEWLKIKRGMLVAPPRTGKTVLAVYIACKLGLRTLIVAHQEDLLRNFYKTFLKMTNLKKLRKKTGKKLVKIIQDVKEIDKHTEVAILTYQKFIKKETAIKRIAKHLNGKYGFLILDEAHLGSATAYAKFLNILNMKYKLPMSATPNRKDKLERVVFDVVGNPTVISQSVALIPKLELFFTKIKPKNAYSNWTYAMQFLANNKERNKLIIRQVFKDLREGHKIILVTDFRHHVNTLVKMINTQSKINNFKRKEDWPINNAIEFYSGSNRKKILQSMEDGEHNVIVAIRSLMKQGIDLQSPTCIYSLVPTNNASMAYQLFNRVCTPYKNKRQPIVRIFIDDLGQSIGCYKSLFRTEIVGKLKEKNLKDGTILKPKYLMDQADLDKSFELLRKQSDYRRKRWNSYRKPWS